MFVANRAASSAQPCCSRSASAVLQPCSRLPQVHSSVRHWRRAHSAMMHAAKDGKSPQATTTTSSSPSSSVEDDEARIEALEASTRKAKSKAAARRPIPIRNVTPRAADVGDGRVEWKEGSLFPEGWEQMDVGQKISELYLGKRGLLFWANKLAWGAVIALGGAWVLFRVGGAIGLYKLQGDLTLPPL